MEDANVHLNFSGHNMWDDTVYYVPDYEFSSTQIAIYSSSTPKKDLSNVPKIARYAPKNIKILDGKTYYNIHAENIMYKVLLSRLSKTRL